MTKNRIEKVKLLALVRDWSLWPRYEAKEFDSTNLARIKQAILAGQKLPPIVVDEKSMRIVDGFHRHEVNLKLYGDDAEIEVEFRRYKNDGEMFGDSMELNAKGPLPLSPQDKIHCILQARKLKIPPARVCEALGMTKERYDEYFEKRVATTKNGEKIPVSYGAIKLSDYSRAERNRNVKPLTRDEEKAVRSQGGTLPVVYMRLLLDMLRARVVPLTDKEAELLTNLYAEIGRVLRERKVA